MEAVPKGKMEDMRRDVGIGEGRMQKLGKRKKRMPVEGGDEEVELKYKVKHARKQPRAVVEGEEIEGTATDTSKEEEEVEEETSEQGQEGA